MTTMTKMYTTFSANGVVWECSKCGGGCFTLVDWPPKYCPKCGEKVKEK